MIQYTTGNLLDADTQALVNTVNTVGVMGKGIALQFRERFKHNYKRYLEACERGELAPGKLLVTTEHTMQGDRTIINFPTKTEYFRRSSYAYIEAGLKELVRVIGEHRIKSIALPPLGCGHGGLDWIKVKPLIEQHLGPLDIRVVVYEPSAVIKEILQQERRKEARLTPARAMLMHALFDYERMGEPASLFVANKLAFFLQELGEPMKLKFEPYHYGPYSPQVAHLLYVLNGTYLHGLEQKDARPFEELHLNHDRSAEVEEFVAKELDVQHQLRLRELSRLIEGFCSTYALELLSSVAYIRKFDRQAGIDQIRERMSEWSERKEALAGDRMLQVAVQHLDEYGRALAIA